MATMEILRAELRAQLSQAERRGVPYVDIDSGELHRNVGDHPGQNHTMPSCCNVMYEEQSVGEIILFNLPKGRGATLSFRNKPPR